MSRAVVTIKFVVGLGHCDGDYAMLHGSGGSGDIDWDNPLTQMKYELFPNGGGIFGWGHAPWGHFRWGHCHSKRCLGWGHLPWGHFPWGHGTNIIRAKVVVDVCGDYKFGFACYDKFGNKHEGSPEEIEVSIHLAPQPPTGLKKNSYNKETNVLILDAA